MCVTVSGTKHNSQMGGAECAQYATWPVPLLLFFVGILILKTCRAVVNVLDEGFIQTPGYPNFYVGGRPCNWTLRAPPHKQIQLQFLDISLREMEPRPRSKCRDLLRVSEHGLDMLATCGDVWEPEPITSVGPELNVTLVTASINIFPKRGLLFHYKCCTTPEPPQDGYLVTKNETTIYLRCNPGYVFPDTAIRDRLVDCHEPRLHIPHCVYVGLTTDEAVTKMNLTEKTLLSENSQDSSVADIVLPSVIIGVLFFLNAFILAAVYVYKKRLIAAGPDPWENNHGLQPQKLKGTN